MEVFHGVSEMKITVVLEPSDEGGFVVSVPALPGCLSEGNTKKEALKNIREAIEVYLERGQDEIGSKPGRIIEIIDV